MRKTSTTLTLALAALLVAAACTSPRAIRGPGVSGAGESSGSSATVGAGSGSPDEVVDLGSEDVLLTSGLVRFSSCDALLDHLRNEYAKRVGPWGFNDGGWWGPMPLREVAEMEMASDDMMMDDSGMAESAAAVTATADGADTSLQEGVDYSGTNVQEAGVDEADLIKTDGRRIFTLSDNRLVVVDVASREVTGSVAVAEGWQREMFIDGDSLLLVAQSYDNNSGASKTIIQKVDTEGNLPTIAESISVEGQYLSARLVGGTARVVLRFDPHMNFPFVYPQNDGAEEVAENANRAAVRASTLDDWLPHFSPGTDRPNGPRLTPCDAVHVPSEFSGFGVTTVISVPVSAGLDTLLSTAVTAPGDTVYASTGSLYLATTRWLDAEEFADEVAWRRAVSDRHTSIHRFDLSGPRANYEATGQVEGEIHNQFSLSEHDGHLRVVTTVGDGWNEETESWVRVLSIDGDRLVEVGNVGDIGKGERVYSVRFVGDIGYVVTFRQIDPFYTIDLSDPTDPRVLGELKIPGFSSYLHPISDSLVLGVGSEADPTGRVTGAKVSLFDVSDLTDPREVAVWSAPDGWNDVGWDHRAFLWWAPEELAVIPVAIWSPDRWAGAVVLNVADGTISEVGRVDHYLSNERVGDTDCRKITVDDLPTRSSSDFSTELEFVIAEEYTSVLSCGGDAMSMVGFQCSRADSFFVTEAAALNLDTGGETLVFCWPQDDLRVISRSIVIGDDLWTLGFRGFGSFSGNQKSELHVHDLSTLDRLAAVRL